MQATKKLLDIARDRRKILKKEKEKRKMRKSQRKSQTATTISFAFYFLYRKICILLEGIFGKL